MTLEEARDKVRQKLQDDYGVPDENGETVTVSRKAHSYTPAESALYMQLSLTLGGLESAIKLKDQGQI